MYNFIYSRFINSSGEKISDKIQFLIFSVIRKLLLKFGDPLINYTLWGSEIKIPFSYNLPLILKNHPHYNSNLLRISLYLGGKYRELKLIDVGANIGDTVVLLKSKNNLPILCIEGDDVFFNTLKINSANYSDIKLEKVFLGESESVLNAKLSTKLGTGSITSSEENKIEIVSLDNLLKRNDSFLKSKLIKIDTDGFDFKILRGASEYIKNTRPVIFIEYDPHFQKLHNEDPHFIFEFLKPLGYTNIIFYDNFGDFLISLSIGDDEKILELTNYFTNRNSLRYCDLCFFHREDEDIFNLAKQKELEFFLLNRKN